MDSFTQIALGIAIAEVCAGKKLKNKTVLYGAVLGTIPDLDVVVGLFLNPVDAVLIHRGISHSLFLFLFLSPLLGWIISKTERDKINFVRQLSWHFGVYLPMFYWICLLLGAHKFYGHWTIGLR